MLYLVNNRADLIMLGSLRGAHDAGIYAVASKAGDLVIFFLMAASMVLSPRIARFYHKSEHERLATFCAGSSVVLNVALNAAFIPLYGVKGAAISTGTSLIVWNILPWYWTHRRLGLRSSIFGI